jgi:hypothetical protein
MDFAGVLCQKQLRSVLWGFNAVRFIMAVSVRIYLTAGIAMAGASAIAAAPIPPHIQIRASHPVVVVDDINLTAFTPTGFLNTAETILWVFESASTMRTGAGVNQIGTALINTSTTGLETLGPYLEKRSWCRLKANAQ